MVRVLSFTIILIALALVSLTSNAQNTEVVGDTISQKDALEVESEEPPFKCEVMPQYPDGGAFGLLMSIRKQLEEKFGYQETRLFQCFVLAQYVIEEDGTTTDFKILRSTCPTLDEEVIRILRKMPRWIPGTEKGIPTRIRYIVPIRF